MDPIGGSRDTPWTPEAAFRYCERLAKTHYENFTVGSRLLPQAQRRHVYAVYAYCRSVDDLGDEDTSNWELLPPVGALCDATDVLKPERERHQRQISVQEKSRRLALLDWWEGELRSCYSGTPTHPVMVALQRTIFEFDIPARPFLKLIEANRMDQKADRYSTYTELLHYCDHSANPVGHLFLYLFGYRDEERQRLADATCTALQLTNFWQDIARDYRKGRIYLPQEDMQRFGCTEADLASGSANQQFRRLMAFQVNRAGTLFREGAPLVDTLEGAVQLDVALFTRGGAAVLDAIKKRNYDILSSRPALTRTRKATLFASTWLAWKLGLNLLPEFKEPSGAAG